MIATAAKVDVSPLLEALGHPHVEPRDLEYMVRNDERLVGLGPDGVVDKVACRNLMPLFGNSEFIESAVKKYRANRELVVDITPPEPAKPEGSAAHPFGVFAELAHAVKLCGPTAPSAFLAVARGFVHRGSIWSQEHRDVAKKVKDECPGLADAVDRMDSATGLALAFGLSTLVTGLFRQGPGRLFTTGAGLSYSLGVVLLTHKAGRAVGMFLVGLGLLGFNVGTDFQRVSNKKATASAA